MTAQLCSRQAGRTDTYALVRLGGCQLSPVTSGPTHHQITSVRERFIDLKRTIKYGLKRTIQDRWHRAGFVAIGELLLEPITSYSM